MAQTTLSGPLNNAVPFNTGDGGENGQHPKEIIDALNTMLTELYASDTAAALALTTQSAIKFVNVTITTAQLKALNATPQTILAAPGANLANVIDSIVAYKAAGTAYAGIAGGEDLSVKYTDASGLEVLEIETTGFLDQTTAQTRYASSFAAASGISSITPVANAAMVMMLLSGEITTGDSDLKLRVYYRTVPTTL
jgi:hypothetical protein